MIVSNKLIHHDSKCRCSNCDHILFGDEIKIEIEPDNTVKLLCHWIGNVVDGKAVLIKRGYRRKFVSDGGSIPKIAWSVIGHPLEMPGLQCYLAHDAEYSAELFDRAECDRRLRDGLKLAGVGLIKRNAIYLAVRAGGWAVWLLHTAESINEAKHACKVITKEERDRIKKLGYLAS